MRREYVSIPVPALAVHAMLHDLGPRVPKSVALTKRDDADSINVSRRAQAFAYH